MKLYRNREIITFWHVNMLRLYCILETSSINQSAYFIYQNNNINLINRNICFAFINKMQLLYASVFQNTIQSTQIKFNNKMNQQKEKSFSSFLFL